MAELGSVVGKGYESALRVHDNDTTVRDLEGIYKGIGSLSPSGVTKEIDLQARGEAESSFMTDRNEEFEALVKGGLIAALGHEEYFFWWN